MLITEILDKTVYYTVVKQESHLFKTACMINRRKIVFECFMDDGTPDVWEGQFWEEKKGKIEYGMSGSGGELEVIKFAQQTLLELIKIYNPKKIMFDAAHDSGKSGKTRGNVYERLIKRIKVSGYSYERIDQSDDDEEDNRDVFVLSRKE